MRHLLWLWFLSGKALAGIGSAPTLVITNGDMSQTSVSSGAIAITGLGLVNFQGLWTGASAAGTFVVQVSEDASTWDSLSLTSVLTASGAGHFSADIIGTAAPYIQVLFTKTAGSAGTLNVTAYGKPYP